jgi:ABC-2 type transport system ATP-binding protein
MSQQATANGSCLRVEAASKSYGARLALDGVSLRVGHGEFVALLGPNGAGKSTLFQLLTGLFNPDCGRVVVCDHDLGHNAVAALAHIGVVFQQATLDGDRSVHANLRFHAGLHGIGGNDAAIRIEDALSRLGLGDRSDDKVRELSGGNRRKVELARALVHRPSVLLMDEATVGLDPASRRQLLAEVRSFCEQGVGVLWATHLVDEAEQADRVIVLHRGKVLADTTPSELAARSPVGSLAEAFMAMTGPPVGTA